MGNDTINKYLTKIRVEQTNWWLLFRVSQAVTDIPDSRNHGDSEFITMIGLSLISLELGIKVKFHNSFGLLRMKLIPTNFFSMSYCKNEPVLKSSINPINSNIFNIN